ncbi:MAG: hydroxymethylbilane synthase [Planctomycetota bacterium]|jgi:hydroxymethylbilane synthase
MIVFGCRGSRLALRQTEQVAERIKAATGEDYRLEVIETSGDRVTDRPLAEIGIKGLFTAELTQALREGRIDVAVHSLKDLPVEDPDGLALGAIPVREDPHDVLVYDPRHEDPEGGTLPLRGQCTIGTSSPRRTASVQALRPDLVARDIRGNVPTRVRKVQDGDYHGVVLAAAGLARLELCPEGLSVKILPQEQFTPAPGQGALGVQCRADDKRVRQLLGSVHDDYTAECVAAERKVLLLLGGGCSMPLGVLVHRDPEGGDTAAGYRMQVSLFADDVPGCGVSLSLAGDDADALAEQAAAELRPLLRRPLAGTRVVLLRPDNAGGRLGAGLALAGAEVTTVAVTEVQPHTADLSDAPLDIVAFTSCRAVDRFFELAAAHDLQLDNTRFFAGGPVTCEAVVRRGHDCKAPPDPQAGGEALAELLLGAVPRDQTVLFPCALERHGALEERLRAHDQPVQAVPVYRKSPIPGVEVPDADCYVVTSPSAVEAIADGERRGRYLALGETTAAAMVAAGQQPDGVATAPSAKALVALIQQD